MRVTFFHEMYGISVGEGEGERTHTGHVLLSVGRKNDVSALLFSQTIKCLSENLVESENVVSFTADDNF